MKRKIGPLLLSGLIIGPILGSGIILLPPLAYGKLGNLAIWSWAIILALGAIFAIIFSKLSVLYPGEGGMTIAIERSLGSKFKLYSSFLMAFAVSFGPTAVMLTASDYLNNLGIFKNINVNFIAIILVIGCFFLLTRDLKFISTLSFIFSSIITVILLISSSIVLQQNGINVGSVAAINWPALLKTTMLLFWAIIGFEIIGNYSEQVKDLKKTIPLATIISLIVITLTYLLTALAIQTFSANVELSMVSILEALFGKMAVIALALLVTGLCIFTYLLIVGALGRLIHALALEKYLPGFFTKKNKNNAPVTGILYFTVTHIIVLILTGLGFLNLELIVATANGFFLANALIGLIAAFKLIDCTICRIGCVILSISLFILLLFSGIKVFIAMIIVYFIAHYLSKKQNHQTL